MKSASVTLESQKQLDKSRNKIIENGERGKKWVKKSERRIIKREFA